MRPLASRHLEQRTKLSRTVVLTLLRVLWLVVIAAVVVLASKLTDGPGS